MNIALPLRDLSSATSQFYKENADPMASLRKTKKANEAKRGGARSSELSPSQASASIAPFN
jgi:hypothetical protein